MQIDIPRHYQRIRRNIPGRFSGWVQHIPPSPSKVGMNSSMNKWGFDSPTPCFAAKWSNSSTSDGSNFTPAGRPGHSWAYSSTEILNRMDRKKQCTIDWLLDEWKEYSLHYYCLLKSGSWDIAYSPHNPWPDKQLGHPHWSPFSRVLDYQQAKTCIAQHCQYKLNFNRIKQRHNSAEFHISHHLEIIVKTFKIYINPYPF